MSDCVEPETKNWIRWDQSTQTWTVSHFSPLSGKQYIKKFTATEYEGNKNAGEISAVFATYMQMSDEWGMIQKDEEVINPEAGDIVVVIQKED